MRMDIDALRARTPGCAGRVRLEQFRGSAAGAADAGCDDRPVSPGGGSRRVRGRCRGGRRAIAATYAVLAELTSSRSQEIALFDNATTPLERGVLLLPLLQGDQILTGRAEYGSNVLAYWQAARRTGAEVIVVPNDQHGQLDVAALERLAGERTALIGVSHVPTSGGLVQPAEQIGRIARGCGALYLLDATQSVGQFPVNVDAIGCDLLTGAAPQVPARPAGHRVLVGARRPRWRSWIRSSPRSARRPGTDTRASPGPMAPADRERLGTRLRQRAGPGHRRAPSPRSAAWPRNEAARHRAGYPAPRPVRRAARRSGSTTLAGPAAPSSPPRSTMCQLEQAATRLGQRRGERFHHRTRRTTRWTPKAGASTR